MVMTGVHRYNAAGVEGLKSRAAPGATPKLTEAQMAELREPVLAGPDPEIHHVVRWRCIDLREEVEGTIGRWLRKFRLTRLHQRPFHPKKDVAAQEAFKKFRRAPQGSLAGRSRHKPVEIWFQDEARVGQKGSLTYLWAPIGSRPPMVRDNLATEQHCPSPTAGLFTRAEPHADRLGIPSRQQTLRPCLGRLRRHPESLRRCMELVRQRP
jgi:transposase